MVHELATIVGDKIGASGGRHDARGVQTICMGIYRAVRSETDDMVNPDQDQGRGPKSDGLLFQLVSVGLPEAIILRRHEAWVAWRRRCG